MLLVITPNTFQIYLRQTTFSSLSWKLS